MDLAYGGEGGIRTLVGGFLDRQNGLAKRVIALWLVGKSMKNKDSVRLARHGWQRIGIKACAGEAALARLLSRADSKEARRLPWNPGDRFRFPTYLKGSDRPKLRTWVRFPIARSINPVDAVGFTGFPPPKSPLSSPILDAVGREILADVDAIIGSHEMRRSVVNRGGLERPIR